MAKVFCNFYDNHKQKNKSLAVFPFLLVTMNPNARPCSKLINGPANAEMIFADKFND